MLRNVCNTISEIITKDERCKHEDMLLAKAEVLNLSWNDRDGNDGTAGTNFAMQSAIAINAFKYGIL